MVGTVLLFYVSGVCWLCWLSDDVLGSTPSPPATPTPHPKHPNMDNINKTLDNVLSNPRLRENYIRCFLDKGICSKEALQLKHILSDVLNMNCTSCTTDQKYATEKFLKYVMEKEPLAWYKLQSKYNNDKNNGHRHDDSNASKESHGDNSKQHNSGYDSDEDERAHGHYHGNSSDTRGMKDNNATHNKSNKKDNATMPTVVKT